MSDLRIAVLGVGQMGASHVETLSSTRSGCQGVRDQRLLRGQGRAGCGAGRCPVGDPIEAINDPDIDAVLLATLALPTLSR